MPPLLTLIIITANQEIQLKQNLQSIENTFKDYADFSGLNIPRKEVLDPNNVFAFEKLNSIKWSANSEKFSIL